jgi:hypothetical protein
MRYRIDHEQRRTSWPGRFDSSNGCRSLLTIAFGRLLQARATLVRPRLHLSVVQTLCVERLA